MKHKIILLLIAMILVMSCVGCVNHSPSGDYSQKPPAEVNNELPNEQGQNENVPGNNIAGDTEDVNPANGEELFEISDLSGTVTEFFDDGCKISPTIYEDDIAYEAAPGYEDQQEQVFITYGEECIFQIAYVNIQTGKTTYDTASVNDIKKQTRLIICGEYDSDNVLHADRVFIYRNME